MNNVVMRRIVLTGSYQPVATQRVTASVTVSCPPTNRATAFFKGDDGADVPWVPGEFHEFNGIDLSSLQVKGTAGDVVTVVGGTW